MRYCIATFELLTTPTHRYNTCSLKYLIFTTNQIRTFRSEASPKTLRINPTNFEFCALKSSQRLEFTKNSYPYLKFSYFSKASFSKDFNLSAIRQIVDPMSLHFLALNFIFSTIFQWLYVLSLSCPLLNKKQNSTQKKNKP